ncbi:HK97 family phage prohead protease [Andreprevotia chitinilytica]|uniref:HK97 family phage prohead protease n=1 Tax=Andreprevotia chitinilytica TaxID=396808 RepID=UPI000558D0AA|nr:HK97 family phage prohead protease [Andreprevotia chitinilytica]
MDRLHCTLELKTASNDGGAMTFAGYGSVFGNVDLGGDVVVPGAFAKAIESATDNGIWPSMLMQHGFDAGGDTPVGIYTAMKEDAVGLWLEGKLAPTPRGQEAYQLMKMEPRPAISGLSIGYLPKSWEHQDKDGKRIRLLKSVDLLEVSLVTFPMNTQARVTHVKSDLTIRAAERALRDAGFSAKEAKSILAHGFHTLPPRDAEETGELLAQLKRNIHTLTH